jgi:hypothetical protein
MLVVLLGDWSPRIGSVTIAFLCVPQDQFSLEHICGGTSVFPTPEKTINILINLVLPLCVRMGCGRRGISRFAILANATEKLTFATNQTHGD